MHRVGIAAKITSKRALEAAQRTAVDLTARGYEVFFDHSTGTALKRKDTHHFQKSELAVSSDLLITFGGDGTLLSVARHAPEGVPIIGVNMGTLGFLTEIRADEFAAVLDGVLAGKFRAEARVAFDVVVEGRNGPKNYRVLNDAVINKSALARIIEIRVTVGGRFVSTFRADGLIIATPTGSTAYNLSAGGPIIYPTMRAVVLTPICPHMLSNRPIVLPDEEEIAIEIVTPRQEVFLTLDGQEGIPVTEKERVVITKSAQQVNIVQSPTKNYFDVLRNKLKWGDGRG
jgi:NAD+ kinase